MKYYKSASSLKTTHLNDAKDNVPGKHPKKSNSPWDAIVIGSGMGGMGCAAALSKLKKRVLLLEQHYVPGGFTHTFSRKGFVWDVGVHCLGEMGANDLPPKMIGWLSSKQIKMKSLGKVYETFHFPDHFKIEFPDNYNDFHRILTEHFPQEKEAIDKYFKLVLKVIDSGKLFFALRALPQKVDQLISKTFFKEGRKLWEKTTSEVLDEITSNTKLKAILTAQWGYYGSTPSHSSFGIHAMVVRHFWAGGYYPVGGSQVFAESFLETISNAGGDTCTRTLVKEIIVKKGKAIGVRTATGEEFFAPKIISAVGAKSTVKHLLPEEYSTSPWGSEILSIGESPSYICLNLGFEGDILAAGATHSNQWFFETWDIELSEWDVQDPKAAVPVIYLSFPSLKDPTHLSGPKGRHTGEAVTFVPWKAFEKWQNSRRGNRDSEYLTFKKSLEQRMIAQLRKLLPKLMDLVVYHEMSTPLSTEFFTRTPQGAIYGLEATPRRFNSPHLRTRTPIQNLYLAGGDVATLGVTGALVGGILAAGTINPQVWFHAFRDKSQKTTSDKDALSIKADCSRNLEIS